MGTASARQKLIHASYCDIEKSLVQLYIARRIYLLFANNALFAYSAT